MATKINIQWLLSQATEFDVSSISFNNSESSKRFRKELDNYIEKNFTPAIEFKEKSHGTSEMYGMHGVKILFKQ